VRVEDVHVFYSRLFVEQPFCRRTYFHWDAIYLNWFRIGVCQDQSALYLYTLHGILQCAELAIAYCRVIQILRNLNKLLLLR